MNIFNKWAVLGLIGFMLLFATIISDKYYTLETTRMVGWIFLGFIGVLAYNFLKERKK